MIKKIISAVISGMMVLTAVPTNVFAASDEGNIQVSQFQSYNFKTRQMHISTDEPGRAVLDEDAKSLEDSKFKVVPGLADSTYASIESVSKPGYYLAQVPNYTSDPDGGTMTAVLLKQNDSTDDFKKNATFKVVPGLADPSWVSFQAYTDPTLYIRHFAFRLRMDKNPGPEDATFRDILKPNTTPANASILTINAANKGITISPDLYGIFFEDISHAADGGIYAELISNRSFEDGPAPQDPENSNPNLFNVYPPIDLKNPPRWSMITTGGANGDMTLDTTGLLNDAQKHDLKLEVKSVTTGGSIGVANEGFWGINVKDGVQYNLFLFAKASSDFKGVVKASLQSADGSKTYASTTISDITADWSKLTATLTAKGSDTNAKFVLSTDSTGSLWFDVVSLFPPTFNNEANGLRPDIANMVKGLNPKVMRFPGGCFVEGLSMDQAFKWKTTIGNIEDRPGHINKWGYRTSDGLGFHEFLKMSEDLGSTPLYVANIGVSHYRDLAFNNTADKGAVPLDQLGPWIQDALDAIEYANGDATTKYGAMRIANGHPAPFNLKYLEIGNENVAPAWNDQYNERYKMFYDAIKAKYPNILCIGNTEGWGTDTPSWKGGSNPVDILDEHYYRNAQWCISNSNKYDNYDRKGPAIYVGEYSAQGQGQTLEAAVGEAAFLTGIERNSDIVKICSYAPLLCNENASNWGPDAIYYNSSQVYGTPSYYVQAMFGQNVGTYILPTTLTTKEDSAPAPTIKGPLYYVSSRDEKTGDIIIKVANPKEVADNSTIVLNGVDKVDSTGSVTVLTSDDATNENSFNNPTKVSPVTTQLTGIGKTFNYTFKPSSVTVIRFKANTVEQVLTTSVTVFGANTITTDGGTLQMSANVLPENATDKSIIWSVTDSDGKATNIAKIAGDGVLKAVSNGTVKVTATANDGSKVSGSMLVTLSGQTSIPKITDIAQKSKATTSYCSSWEKLTAINNGIDPITSADKSNGVYGNWPQHGLQWVQYDFDKAYKISSSDVYWFVDGGGVQLPSKWDLKYWDDTTSDWKEVQSNGNQQLQYGIKADQYNTCEFAPVVTTKLRLEVYSGPDSSNTDQSSGISQWKVTGEDVGSTPTPPPTPTSDFIVKSIFNLSSLDPGKMLYSKTAVTNNKSYEQSALAIVALYDGNDKMVNVSYISKNIAAGATENLNAGFKLPSDVANYKVKVFVWDGTDLVSSNMNPLSNIVTLP